MRCSRQCTAECSPDGREHFDEFLAKTYAMWASEPSSTPVDLAKVSVPVLVLVADNDTIALSHTCLLYESIPGAQLAVVPGASHLLPIEQPEKRRYASSASSLNRACRPRL